MTNSTEPGFEEAVRSAATATMIGEDAAGKLAGKRVLPAENLGRTFVTPTHLNGRFLVRYGRTEEAPYNPAVIGIRPAVRREGDLWAKFTNGICLTMDEMEAAGYDLDAISGWAIVAKRGLGADALLPPGHAARVGQVQEVPPCAA